MFTAKRVGDPKDYIKGESGDWEVIIGLEVHAGYVACAERILR